MKAILVLNILIIGGILFLFSSKSSIECVHQASTEQKQQRTKMTMVNSVPSSSSGNSSTTMTTHTTTTSSSLSLSSFEMAYEDSFGYFDDIPQEDWEEMRNITLNRVNNINPNNVLEQRQNPKAWYQNNWDPDFSCRHDTKVGMGDGAKWVCDPKRLIQQSKRRTNENEKKPGCIVYSVGSNGDFRFEQGVADLLPGSLCEIHTFDFTDYSDRVPTGRSNIHFHHWGLKPSYAETKNTADGNFRTLTGNELNLLASERQRLGQNNQNNYVPPPFKTFAETVKTLGHEGLPIDIFKIDCEGCEWGTYKDWIQADIRQLLVEVHRVPEIANDFFQDLQHAGYVTYHKEPNIQYADGNCVEYAMLKLKKSYVENRINDKQI